MKKPSKALIIDVFVRLVVLFCVAVIFFIVPGIYVGKKVVEDNYQKNRSSYQGILELWNIDTFEGGSASKSGYLKTCAINYEKSHKGLYVMVKNMTETQFFLALESGQTPNMVSFGIGVGAKIADKLIQLNFSNGVLPIFAQSGTSGGKTLSVPWCRGVYALISSESKLTRANQSSENLIESVYSSGYKTPLKNHSEKITYSVVFGGANYTSPNLAISADTAETELSVSAEVNNFSPYDAYCNFIDDKSTILLGTQRDVARILNRTNLGRFDGAIIEYLPQFTDLVQHIAVFGGQNQKITNICTNFLQFMLSNSVQTGLESIFLLPTTSAVPPLTDTEYAKMYNSAKNVKNVKNIFG